MQETILEKKSSGMITCYIHDDKNAVGTCVGCGKFICQECSTEVDSKYYCKPCINKLFLEKNKKVESLENRQMQQPNIFMNAGGASSSSSSSSSNDGYRYKSSKSRTTAAILALFFGTLGIHKFYLGQFLQGFIYLLFCWTGIPTLLGFLEFIVYLSYTDKKFDEKYG
jgi:TM2 domain-containing membrane protein YozV